MINHNTQIAGILAEFDTPAELLKAAERVHYEGFKAFDCHSPFPIHGMDAAMGLKRSPLGFVIFLGGLAGALTGISLQGWTSVIDYPLVISGKPLFSLPAFIPITFELTILFAAFSAVFGMFVFNRMPTYHHPLFSSERFEKATDDGFFISIDADDPQFDVDNTRAFLQSIGSTYVEVIQCD